MKKKSASKSAFFNLRVLIGLCIALAGISLALVGLDAFAANSLPVKIRNHIITASNDPLVPVGFDCSKIEELGIHKQENFRAGAIMIACAADGASGFSSVSGFFQRVGQGVKRILLPLYGAGDVNLINHPETSPNITQSETFSTVNPDNPQQIVVAYNDSRGRNASPINISGASVSTDGGATFDRLTLASGQSPFAGTEGDPVILYNKPSQTWFTVWLDTACGGQGLGGYKSTTPWDPTSWTHFCVFNEASADRESGFADNNPSSPFFGRMYISWNDFNVGGGALFVRYSTDNGLTWTNSRQVTTSFIRDVQITGDKVTGDVYIAGMDENGGNGCTSGCGTTRNNKIYRSTDGGNTWANTYTGPSFVGPCRSNSGFFCTMYSSPAYWRHMGWGEPAAFNHVVSLVYSAKNGSDPGDVFYIRSTDSGVTFGAPVQLNSNTDPTKAQWMPNLSVSEAGTLFATWYDETPRTSASCQPSSPTNLCYQMHSNKSPDNGVTWLGDQTTSDVASPLPLQPDPGIQPTYVGDYDYGSAVLTKHWTSWTDGRNAINGASQQDAYTDKELVGFAVTTTTPACNSVVTGTAPVDFVINLSDAVDTSTVQASDFTVNGTPSNLPPTFSNGNTTITFHYTTTPVVTGLNTMHIPAGAFLRASDNAPNFEFNCTFCYAITPLQVASTNPPVGGTFSPPAPNDYQYDVNFNQAVDPTSVTTSDLMITGNVGGSVTNVQVVNNNMTARFTLHFSFGGSVTLSITAGAIAAQSPACNTNQAFTGTYMVQGCPPAEYTTTTGTGTITPGGIDIGNHCDDCTTNITLPFPVSVYGNPPVTAVAVGSDGDIHFPGPYNKLFWWPGCVPVDPGTGQDPFLNTFFPEYADLVTDTTVGPCPNCGIFTQTVGTAPNRQFLIRWLANYFNSPPGPAQAEFEVLLTEGSNTLSVIYGMSGDNGLTAVTGIQQDLTHFTSFSCDTPVLTPGLRVNYIPPSCGSPTPTPTPTGTPSPTPTASPSATATATPTATATAAGCSWSAGPNMPTVLVRAVGVYFPADGNFYTMGGRTADTAGSDFQHVLKYSPASNTWTQMGVTLPDNQMNNMACGVLTLGGTPEIYCVGGSAAGQTTASARVFYYNPAADNVVTLGSGDNWPGAMGTILPGGFAETGNKMYILGGFNINVASTNQIWSFDPNAAVGSKWVLAPVTTPEGIMYAPTCAISGIIYVGGASDYQGGLVVDTTNSFSFNPATNTIGSIAAIPRATGETRGLTFNGKMYVMGGGRVAPNPSTEVDVYNPGTNTWSTDLPFTTARRNFPTDTNGTNKIWLSGGYASDGITPLSSMEIFMCQGAQSPTPTATPTATATATHTPTATPTATATATHTPTATPTATATATHTPTATPTATATATHTPTATPTATATSTPTSPPRRTPTPRPYPTPPPRP
jgi:hypothetical protein